MRNGSTLADSVTNRGIECIVQNNQNICTNKLIYQVTCVNVYNNNLTYYPLITTMKAVEFQIAKG